MNRLKKKIRKNQFRDDTELMKLFKGDELECDFIIDGSGEYDDDLKETALEEIDYVFLHVLEIVLFIIGKLGNETKI